MLAALAARPGGAEDAHGGMALTYSPFMASRDYSLSADFTLPAVPSNRPGIACGSW
jgi:hypothetical protein